MIRAMAMTRSQLRGRSIRLIGKRGSPLTPLALWTASLPDIQSRLGADLGVDTGLGQARLETTHVQIGNKSRHRILYLRHPALGSGRAVGQAGHDDILLPVFHSRLQVGPEH